VAGKSPVLASSVHTTSATSDGKNMMYGDFVVDIGVVEHELLESKWAVAELVRHEPTLRWQVRYPRQVEVHAHRRIK